MDKVHEDNDEPSQAGLSSDPILSGRSSSDDDGSPFLTPTELELNSNSEVDDDGSKGTPNSLVQPTADQVLSAFGPFNPYLLFIWCSMSSVWALSGLVLMTSSFTMGVQRQQSGCNNTDAPTPSGRQIIPNNPEDPPTVFNCSSAAITVPIPGTLNAEFFDPTGAAVGWATHSAFLVGTCLGSCLLPQLSDRCGRRVVMLWSVFLLGVFGLASALAPSLPTFVALRFATGTLFTGCGVTNWVLAYESVPQRLRSYTALVFGLAWVIGYCAVAPLAYALPSWRALTAVCALPSVLLAAVFYLTIPESFHFLVLHRRTSSIRKWIACANHLAHRRSRVDVDVGELCAHAAKQGQAMDAGDIHYSHSSLFHTLSQNRTLMGYTAVMIYLWACNTFIYYGLSLFSDQLEFDRYWKHVLIGVAELPSYFITPFVLDLMGRRAYICVCHLLAAVSLFLITNNNQQSETLSFPASLFEPSPQLNMTLWMVGKFAIASSFTSLFVYASELFPTAVRNGCIGVCSVVARLAGASSPAVSLMEQWIHPLAPTLFYSTVSTGAAALVLLLPETLGRDLPDTAAECMLAARNKARRGEAEKCGMPSENFKSNVT